eukprot:TRINITY_DN4438_c0_g1_i2.p1 TRINITY_DN4438_c0_g1~~TRINITY_DN4438_c0_g1_i2.p1  ORF type:complete len:388 (+),score=82.97 TRINITY_DN4438_c0_g1_i2:73-1236(+)
MDALAAIKAEAARRREQLKKDNLVTDKRKYFKRSQLESMQEQATPVEQAKQRRRSSGEGVGLKPAHDENDDLPDITEDEVHRRLRSLGEPIKLFAETLLEKRQRLQELELKQGELNQNRQRNELHEALANVDEMILNELLKQGEGEAVKARAPKYTWRDMQQLGQRLRRADDGLAQVLIRRYLRFLLDSWGQDLDNRPAEMKQMSEGRLASATFKQTEGYMKPLFVKLKKKQASEAVVQALREIVEVMLKRDYIAANDAYLGLAIGNAAWPIGVTSVGIHSRTGRERISTQKIAHALNDETQRKYIQGIKRLMTFSQKRFPNVPSKCLEFRVSPEAVLLGSPMCVCMCVCFFACARVCVCVCACVRVCPKTFSFLHLNNDSPASVHL